MKKIMAIMLVFSLIASPVILSACKGGEVKTSETTGHGQDITTTAAATSITNKESATENSSATESDESDTATAGGITLTTDTETAPPNAPLFAEFKIDGVPLFEYKIVYSEEGVYADKTLADLYGVPGDFYKQSADELAAILGDMQGITLSPERIMAGIPPRSVVSGERLIIVGPSDKSAIAPSKPRASDSVADIDNYTVQIDYKIDNVCAGFQFASSDMGTAMWQLQPDGTFNPHIWDGGAMPHYNYAKKTVPSATGSIDGWYTMKIVVRNTGGVCTVTTYVAPRGTTLVPVDTQDVIAASGTTKTDWSLGKIGFRESNNPGNPEAAWFDNLIIWDDGGEVPVLLYNIDFAKMPTLFSGVTAAPGAVFAPAIANGTLYVKGGWGGSANTVAAQVEIDKRGPYVPLGTDDYIVAVENGNLIISGGAYGTTWHAVQYFKEYLAAQKTAGATKLNLTGEIAKGTHHLISIGCVGDSITEGGQGSDGGGPTVSVTPGGAIAGLNYLAYPGFLERLLWKDYVVYNYAKYGTSMRDDLTDNAYTLRPEYENFKRDRGGLDIILILFGTNDSDRANDWSGGGTAKFIADYGAFLDAIERDNGSGTAHILIMNMLKSDVGNYARPEVQNAIAAVYDAYKDKAGYDVSFFDMLSFSRDVLTGWDYMPDHIHPNPDGNKLIAAKLAEIATAFAIAFATSYAATVSK